MERGKTDVDFITWRDVPEQNMRVYRHAGCDGVGSTWFHPLDDCPEPRDRDTEECTNCCYVLPLRRAHRAQRGDEVEGWIKRMRDRFPRDGASGGIKWEALDYLLNRYRECADYGLTLGPEDDEAGDP